MDLCKRQLFQNWEITSQKTEVYIRKIIFACLFNVHNTMSLSRDTSAIIGAEVSSSAIINLPECK